MITSIISVIKRPSDWTILPLFLHYFWILLDAQTTFQLLQVIIISMTYYLSSIVIWSFSYHILSFNCLPVCSHLSYRNSLKLKLVLGCISKSYVGRIQTGHTDFIPPHFCGRPWQGYQLYVDNFSHQLIAFLDMKSPSSYLLNNYFIDCWILCIIFIGSSFIDPGTCPRLWLKIVSGPYPNWTYVIDFLPQVCGRLWQGHWFYFTSFDQYID